MVQGVDTKFWGVYLVELMEESLVNFTSNTFGVIEFTDQFVNVQNSVKEYFTLEKILLEAKC